MAITPPPFSARIVFDHLTKTAGQALRTWLSNKLGEGNVSNNVIDSYQNLLRTYGGIHSIIFSHVLFNRDDRLDMRYEHITILRDPVERVLSWCQFIINDIKDAPDNLHLKRAAIDFWNSNGNVFSDPSFAESVSNYYVNHFACIANVDIANLNEIEQALHGIQKYRFIGIYEELDLFLQQLSIEWDLGGVDDFITVNKTTKKISREEINPEFIARIESLNAHDIPFYNKVTKIAKKRIEQTFSRYPEKLNRLMNGTPYTPRWKKHERQGFMSREFCSDNITLLSCNFSDYCSNRVTSGDWVESTLCFKISTVPNNLIIGVHIHRLDGLCVFGTNTDLLNVKVRPSGSDIVSISFGLQANLTPGTYFIGFSISDHDTNKMPIRLAWWDNNLTFVVWPHPSFQSIGCCFGPARFVLND